MERIILVMFVVVNAILGMILYRNNPRSATNRLFAILIGVLTVYLTINTQLYIFPSFAMKLFLSRFIIALGAIINALVFIFLMTFPKESITMRKSILYGIYGITAALFFAGFTPLIFKNITVTNNVVVPIPGIIMPVFLIHTLVLVFGGIIAIFIRYRKSKGLVRTRIRFVLLGFTILFSLVILLNFIATVFLKYGNFVPLLPVYILIFNIIVIYAIIRHRLMDIRLLVARSVAFTLMIVILASLYSAGVFLIGTYVIGNSDPRLNVMVSTVLALIIAYSFQPLSKRVGRITDRFFYKDHYDSHILLGQLSKIMASTLELDEIVKDLLKTMIKNMKIQEGHVVLVREDDEIWAHGMNNEGTKKIHFVHEYMQYLMTEAVKDTQDNVILADEQLDSTAQQIMHDYGMSVAFPLIVDKKPIGLMMFGEKLSGDVYSVEDIHMFSILAPEIAVAVKNSLQYDEIKRFNTTLEGEVKQATAKLQTANRKLKELDKMKDDFVSVASHELRTPMTAIKSYLWMAFAGKGGALKPKQKFYLERSYTSTDRLIKLVNDMLNISRIESNRISLLFEKVDIVETVKEVVEEVKPRADELKVALAVEKFDDAFIVADKDKVKEVLFNLIGNALKFTPEGGKISVNFTHDGEFISTHVTDSGRGIAAQDIPTLFTKFGMIAGSYASNKKASGTGLGLYISKSIIEMSGGTIDGKSAGIDKGSTFSFSLLKYSAGALEKMRKHNKKGTVEIIRSEI